MLTRGFGLAAFADFSGLQVNGVDQKGRVSMPSAFRATIERRFAGHDLHGEALRTVKMTVVEPGCIEVVDATYIAELKADVMAEAEEEAGGSGVKAKAIYQKKIIRRLSLLADVTYDETGRFVLPAILREEAGIAEEAVFSGGGDFFQIWSPDRFREEFADMPMLIRQMEQGRASRRGAAKA